MRPAPELQQRISHSFRDLQLLERALTHKSYANENKLAEHNERMEFLGDAVLNLVVSQLLMAALPRAPEGELSRLRAMIVSEPSLAAVARDLGLGDYLLLGKGEEQSGGRRKDSLLANTLEALVASIYLDSGLGAASSFIERNFRQTFDRVHSAGSLTDYKTALQELSQDRLKTLPEYRLTSQSGPDHQKEFTVELLIRGEVFGCGTGKSKKEAEQRAAREAYDKLRGQEPGARIQES
ncbi:MAG: ribonuclease III [Nitrospiraceae bacterium]|nr:ribonuclease III [Nitrospiraceae bacterium]